MQEFFECLSYVLIESTRNWAVWQLQIHATINASMVSEDKDAGVCKGVKGEETQQ